MSTKQLSTRIIEDLCELAERKGYTASGMAMEAAWIMAKRFRDYEEDK